MHNGEAFLLGAIVMVGVLLFVVMISHTEPPAETYARRQADLTDCRAKLAQEGK